MKVDEDLLKLRIDRKTKRIKYRGELITKTEAEIEEIRTELTLAEEYLTHLLERLNREKVSLEMACIELTNINMSKI